MTRSLLSCPPARRVCGAVELNCPVSNIEAVASSDVSRVSPARDCGSCHGKATITAISDLVECMVYGGDAAADLGGFCDRNARAQLCLKLDTVLLPKMG